MKVFIKGVRQSIGLGDVVRQLVDPKGVNTCPACERRRQALNSLLTITGVDPTMPPQVKPRLPSDYLQMYRNDNEEE